MDAIHRRLAQNIRARAKARGLPLTHVADRAGVSRANLWTVLDGTSSPTLKWMAKIAAVLGCEVSDLTAPIERMTTSAKSRKRRR